MEPIDMVYIWCDGTDKRFRADKEKYIAQEIKSLDGSAIGEVRFFDDEELKYSLRSLEENAPCKGILYITIFIYYVLCIFQKTSLSMLFIMI